jgi:hypothetical protein
MDKELSKHNFKDGDKDALGQIIVLLEFTTPSSLNKSLQTTFFAYLKEQADRGQDANLKQVIVDYELLIDFLDELDSKGNVNSAS